MALTNWAALTSENLTVWSRKFWIAGRNASFMNKFTGTGPDSMIQRITELKKSAKGARAVITLVPDMTGDGVAGDRTLEGNEESLVSDEVVIRIDQLRGGNRHKGKMADQKSVVMFREQSSNKLSYWLADRMDQMAFLTLSGVSYAYATNGATRTASQLQDLDFAADVTAPTTSRHFRWVNASSALAAGATASVVAADTPTYAMLVHLKAEAKNAYIKPIRMNDGIDFYHMFMHPDQMKRLKLDSDFLANVRTAGPRGPSNPLFKGTDTIWIDGLAISEFRHVFNTKGATSGAAKWGAGSNIDGARSLLCGAQALAFADIGDPEWVEKGFDYDNQQGLSIGKIFGFKKPVLDAVDQTTDQDFGVIVCDTAI